MVERSETPVALAELLSADGDGPAVRIDAAASARMVDHVIAAAYATDGVARPRRVRPKVHKLGWSVAAAFAIAGSAAAMYAASSTAPPPAVSGTAPALRGGASVQTPVLPAPTAPEPAAPAAASAGQPQAAQSTAPAPSATPARLPARGANAGDDLLERANRLRGEGDYVAAERMYSQVVTRNARGAAAYAARVAAAGLRVERLSNPRGALLLYTQALRAEPKGALAPEIHEGMASAYRMLGRSGDEQRSLRALLREQPTGAAAERARARLSALSVGGGARAR